MNAVLVDTSICIGYLRNDLPPEQFERIHNLLVDERLAINHVVWVELYQGVRGGREERDLKDFLADTIVLETEALCWDTTAIIARRCLRKGVNVPLSDIQIQACAGRYGLELFHNDKHFDLIQSTAS